MKRILTFIICIVLILSISSVSFADISYGLADRISGFSRYKGVWAGFGFSKENNDIYNNKKQFFLILGLYGSSYFATISSYDENSRVIQNIYELVFDKETNNMILINGTNPLTNETDSLSYKLKLEDGQLVLYNITYDTILVRFNKVKVE